MSGGTDPAPRPVRSRRLPPERSTAEWLTFSVASAILLAVALAIASLWLRGAQQPPVFSVRTFAVRATEGGFHVRARVENTGDQTAEAVRVSAEVTFPDGEVQEGEQEIDFLSGGEAEEVEFVFGRDPAHGELEVGVDGYKVP